jgi:Cdc6-like AAA superfamily ATPase
MIKPEAISFLASKISSQSGDIRKALDVCRRALELADLDFKKRKEDLQSKPIDPLGIPQVLRVFKELNPSTAQTAFESVPLHQQILLASAALMSFQSKVSPPINVRKLYETYCKVCKKRSLNPPGFSEVSAMITSLETRGCLITKICKNLSDTKITLRLSVDEIETALKGRKLLDGILQDSDCIAK